MNDQRAESTVSKSIVVQRDIDSTFCLWIEEIHLWWPKGHSISGDPARRMIMEGRVGGRFYERSPDGNEHLWGMITYWEPPHRLDLHWYLGSSQQMPTVVQVRFTEVTQRETRIDVLHRGPDEIGDLWWEKVQIYDGAWERVLTAFDRHLCSRYDPE